MQQNGNPISNMLAILSDFNRFKSEYHGNAQQEVQRLLSTGQMSQQQFNKIQAEASQLYGFMR